jgi:hypothetical protein
VPITTKIVSSNPAYGEAYSILLCDKVCQLHAADQWFSSGTSVSSHNKMGCQPSPFWYLGLQWQQRYKQTIKKNLHRFASSKRDQILSQKQNDNINIDSTIAGSMNASS